MAGRAGRRGKDATGSCLLAIDRSFGRIPTVDDFTEILTSRGTRLESKLKLSYQITLNVVQ
jgi:superfamily II RNA helicase